MKPPGQSETPPLATARMNARPGETATLLSTGMIGANVLFGNRREILIHHAGAQYRLRITRNNKLILTK